MWPELVELAAQRKQLMTAAEAAVAVAKQVKGRCQYRLLD
jgi:hypothetical protein